MSKGSILIYTSAAGQAAPLPGVTLTVTDAGGSVRARLVTDADGFAEAADLPAPMPPTVWTPPTRRCSPTHSTALKLHWTAGSPLC